MIICIQNLVSICQFVFKIWSKNQVLTSIKGHKSVANLQKMTHYNPKVDLVNDNVYTKFGLILSIRSQDIKRKPNYAVMTITERTRFDVFETLCPQQMLVHKGGQIKNWSGECRDVIPTKMQCQIIQRALQIPNLQREII